MPTAASERSSLLVVPAPQEEPVTSPAGITFERLVDEYADAHSEELLDCGQPERFAIAITKLFDIAHECFVVLSDHLCNLSTDVPKAGIRAGLSYWSAPNVIHAACKYLERDGASLQIVIGKKLDTPESSGIGGNEFLRAIIEHEERTRPITIYICPNGMAGKKPLPDVNFVAADNLGVRYETFSVEEKGILTFGPAKTIKKMLRSFQDMVGFLDDAIKSGGDDTPVKLVYSATDKRVDSPSVIEPNQSYKDIVWSKYLIDEQNCVPQPIRIPWTRAIFSMFLPG